MNPKPPPMPPPNFCLAGATIFPIDYIPENHNDKHVSMQYSTNAVAPMGNIEDFDTCAPQKDKPRVKEQSQVWKGKGETLTNEAGLIMLLLTG